jgi:hypothetical protein
MDRSIAGGQWQAMIASYLPVTSRYVADTGALAAAGVRGINFQIAMCAALLRRVADEVTSGRLAPPPIATIKLIDLPAAWQRGQPKIKTVVVP